MFSAFVKVSVSRLGVFFKIDARDPVLRARLRRSVRERDYSVSLIDGSRDAVIQELRVVRSHSQLQAVEEFHGGVDVSLERILLAPDVHPNTRIFAFWHIHRCRKRKVVLASRRCGVRFIAESAEELAQARERAGH